MSNRRKLRLPPRTTFLSRPAGSPDIRWNGQPCTATAVTVVVGDAPQFPEYWARHLIGTVRRALRVVYGGQVFYIDDEDGSGWYKVTHGGGPQLKHRSLAVQSIVIEGAGQ